MSFERGSTPPAASAGCSAASRHPQRSGPRAPWEAARWGKRRRLAVRLSSVTALRNACTQTPTGATIIKEVGFYHFGALHLYPLITGLQHGRRGRRGNHQQAARSRVSVHAGMPQQLPTARCQGCTLTRRCGATCAPARLQRMVRRMGQANAGAGDEPAGSAGPAHMIKPSIPCLPAGGQGGMTDCSRVKCRQASAQQASQEPPTRGLDAVEQHRIAFLGLGSQHLRGSKVYRAQHRHEPGRTQGNAEGSSVRHIAGEAQACRQVMPAREWAAARAMRLLLLQPPPPLLPPMRAQACSSPVQSGCPPCEHSQRTLARCRHWAATRTHTPSRARGEAAREPSPPCRGSQLRAWPPTACCCLTTEPTNPRHPGTNRWNVGEACRGQQQWQAVSSLAWPGMVAQLGRHRCSAARQAGCPRREAQRRRAGRPASRPAAPHHQPGRHSHVSPPSSTVFRYMSTCNRHAAAVLDGCTAPAPPYAHTGCDRRVGGAALSGLTVK